MFTLFSKSLPLDVASRVWDVFCRDGEEFLFRTALGKSAVCWTTIVLPVLRGFSVVRLPSNVRPQPGASKYKFLFKLTCFGRPPVS